MPNTLLSWFLTIVGIIVVMICLIILIRALGDEGAFNLIARRG